MLIDWWGKIKAVNVKDRDVRRDIGLRLRASLQSKPERMLFDTYFREFKPKFGINLPALLPQVHLHYDPRNINERDKPVLVRQRMDFLMLLRNSARIVIEIDGRHHYAEDDGLASPSRYAEMVTEDRRVRILGYEVYRFGGAEFTNTNRAAKTIVSFFEELFERHDIRPDI
jgi:very-short-patch-repair endonuclease